MIELPELPYDRKALAPHISENTINFHYGKHHKAYVDKVNSLIEGGKLATASLEEIVRAAKGTDQGLFNNAAQVWNHTFYWRSMRPNGGGAPKGDIAAMIDRSFGGYDAFSRQFADAGAGQFGSGWAWLVKAGDKLEIRKTPNAETPLTEGVTPLLTMDVWEHAYYLDYQNQRPTYIGKFLSDLVNWDFANENLAR
ncbi:MAG: superoxide dismutase [Alphaproteobacteria bacterium RIFCSPHIGHO2_12_FULL_63_12]|nr:MAG: superoxide dismutase [Alphaproteobacteria bacterium RIFCSPHIGHO2_12_FULL_63_12]